MGARAIRGFYGSFSADRAWMAIDRHLLRSSDPISRSNAAQERELSPS